jgi:hypothetical protein
MEAILVALEASEPAQALRRSVWLYPSANVLHVLGLMGFFAVIAAMDVKALRPSSAPELRDFIRRLRPAAIAFLLLQIATGLMLFLPEATHIAHNTVFLVKLGVIGLALANVGMLEVALARAHAVGDLPSGVRAAAAASLVLWLAVAALGRLIAYF